MSSSAYVDQAADWSNYLTLLNLRGTGDYDRAMRRTADDLGVPHRSLWALRYRKPKSVGAEVYEPLRLAYERFTNPDALAHEFTAVRARLAQLDANLLRSSHGRRAAHHRGDAPDGTLGGRDLPVGGGRA